MTIDEIRQLSHGTSLEGLPLLIKTARETYIDGDEQAWQDVVFQDATGEMPGQILLPDYSPATEGKASVRKKVPPKVWKSKQRVFVLRGELQDSDIRKKMQAKIVVYECRDMAVRLTYDQYNELSEEEGKSWVEARHREIKGKCRTIFIGQYLNGMAMRTGSIPEPDPQNMDTIEAWVDFACKELEQEGQL